MLKTEIITLKSKLKTHLFFNDIPYIHASVGKWPFILPILPPVLANYWAIQYLRDFLSKFNLTRLAPYLTPLGSISGYFSFFLYFYKKCLTKII